MTSPMSREELERARQEVLICLDLECSCLEEVVPAGEEDPANPEHYKDCVSLVAERSFNALVTDHNRARGTEEAQRAVLEALADALRGERSISGAGDCGCENEGVYPYVCVTCRGTKALNMFAALNSGSRP